MDKVIGRERERRALADAWASASAGEPQLAVVWGRRRVGKTFLLTHFAEDKPAVYLTATRQDTEERQLERFAERVREQLGPDTAELLPSPPPNWEAALRFMIGLARTEPILLVLDEAPRLSSSRGDFGDLVSAVWENHARDSHLMLVLSGSAVSVMEQMLGPQGGLHRRPSVELRMDPFDLTQARDFQPALDPDQLVQAYAACGGYPLHLRAWSPDRSVEDNLGMLAFEPGGLLLRDAPDILSEDLDWRGGYERVLAAIAGGAQRRSRIASRAQQRIDHTLDRLRRAGYVRRVRAIGQHASADPMYEIDDTYLAYWFAVLREDADLVEGGQGRAIQRRTTGRWQRHVAAVFEAAARSHAERMVRTGALPESAIVGRWWQDETAEVDVLALDGDSPVLVGECKWSDKPADERVLAKLRAHAAMLGEPGDVPRLALWSRHGAVEAVREYPDVAVFTAADLLE